MNFLAAHPAESFSLSELSVRLDVNAASLHALLGALVTAGYVHRHPRRRTYTLGTAVVALGSAALECHPVVDVARDAARQLAAETDLEVVVTAVAGRHIVFLARAGQRSVHRFPVHVGQQVPFEPPLGSVFVAWGDAEPWLARSDRPEELRPVLDEVRRRGYAVALEAQARRALGDALIDLAAAPGRGNPPDLGATLGELGRQAYQVPSLSPQRRYDVSMVAAPVFGPAGEVAVALTMLGFRPRLSGAEVAEAGERLRDAGLAVTERTRGRPPGSTPAA